MGHIRQGLLILAVVFLPLALCASSNSPIYFRTIQFSRVPPPVPVGKLYLHKIDQPTISFASRYGGYPDRQLWRAQSTRWETLRTARGLPTGTECTV